MLKVKTFLKTFLVNNPERDLDMMDPGGKLNIKNTDITRNLLFLAVTTVLNEGAFKTAQFVEIVEILLEAGSGLGVVDSLGNTP